MHPRANRPAHRLLRSLLASCWLFSPVLVADATTTQHSALATVLSDTRLASWLNLLDNSAGDDERAQLERLARVRTPPEPDIITAARLLAVDYESGSTPRSDDEVVEYDERGLPL